jgi:hypothetical protein
MCQDNKLPKFMIQIQLHLCFIFQMWNVCVVYFFYCNHFTWAKHVRRYTSKNKILELDVLLNNIGCYCRLVMANFTINRSGTNKYVLEFFISSDYSKRKIDVDISLLDNTTSYLSTNALDLFKLWYTHNHMSHKDSYITHPHMWDMVKN